MTKKSGTTYLCSRSDAKNGNHIHTLWYCFYPFSNLFIPLLPYSNLFHTPFTFSSNLFLYHLSLYSIFFYLFHIYYNLLHTSSPSIAILPYNPSLYLRLPHSLYLKLRKKFLFFSFFFPFKKYFFYCIQRIGTWLYKYNDNDKRIILLTPYFRTWNFIFSFLSLFINPDLSPSTFTSISFYLALTHRITSLSSLFFSIFVFACRILQHSLEL